MEEEIVLDPYKCISKRNRKYASECVEVYLSSLNATKISDQFSHFTNLEVIWFNGNRLSRIENLEGNFRIREAFLSDNRLVSLSGLRSFKFLRVLLASNNQLRNLDKQLTLLSRFAFLKQLDLFDNPVAEEPDYRLRLIYHVPQVEVLDRHTVKGPERLRAEEVVPNLDKVSAPVVEKGPRKGQEWSSLERSCIQAARQIAEQRKRDADMALSQNFTSWRDQGLPPPESRTFKANRERWSDPRIRIQDQITRPTPWERLEMLPLITKRAGKADLSRADVIALAEDLASEGLEEIGRKLQPQVVAASLQKDATLAPGLEAKASAVVEKLLSDDGATVPAADVARWLLTLDWPRPDDSELERRIADLSEIAVRAGAKGDSSTQVKYLNTMLRLEGAKTLKHHVTLEPKDPGKSMQKSRTDIFPQSFLKARREMNQATGRMVIKVEHEVRETSLC